MLPFVLSVGAINALVPIIVIIILIGAAAGLTRGFSFLDLFAVGTFMGMGPTRGTKASLAQTGKAGGRLPGSTDLRKFGKIPSAVVRGKIDKKIAIKKGYDEAIRKKGPPGNKAAQLDEKSKPGAAQMKKKLNVTPLSLLLPHSIRLGMSAAVGFGKSAYGDLRNKEFPRVLRPTEREAYVATGGRVYGKPGAGGRALRYSGMTSAQTILAKNKALYETLLKPPTSGNRGNPYYVEPNQRENLGRFHRRQRAWKSAGWFNKGSLAVPLAAARLRRGVGVKTQIYERNTKRELYDTMMGDTAKGKIMSDSVDNRGQTVAFQPTSKLGRYMLNKYFGGDINKAKEFATRNFARNQIERALNKHVKAERDIEALGREHTARLGAIDNNYNKGMRSATDEFNRKVQESHDRYYKSDKSVANASDYALPDAEKQKRMRAAHVKLQEERMLAHDKLEKERVHAQKRLDEQHLERYTDLVKGSVFGKEAERIQGMLHQNAALYVGKIGGRTGDNPRPQPKKKPSDEEQTY